MKRKIVVTGGTGYIGSHTVVELLTRGFEVHIIDNLSNSDASMVDRIEKITGKRANFTKIDLLDKEALHNFFDQINQVDGIIHFAALKSVGESLSRPLSYYENNLQGLNSLLENVRRHKIANFVFSSSCTVYGSPEHLPVTEETPFGHTPSPYGATKQMCERILDDFSQANPFLKQISLRYFNPIGAHDSHLIGELPSGIPNNLMPYITQTAAGLRSELSVFGEDYETPDGTAIRDYIHVSDLAMAHVKALDYLSTKEESICEKINVGTGRGSSVMEVIKSFERTTGIKLRYKVVGRRDGDVESIYANASKAKAMLDWQATYSLDDMTRSAWQWEKQFRAKDH